ncbi:sodium:proton antiporter [Nonlabens sp. MIC269]|uniref:Na+/H+ antiporter NhaC family protein n=1 Tax=Nonlabens sp. MIC269 TaxID=1476901 RepID=UPI00071F55B7|nr:Na+/H+ antiporter NhaC family protein [Nonlabens sp. MIC269]ALM20380.1 sodium:proton antiporter [Nonlabens sp. MIC269]
MESQNINQEDEKIIENRELSIFEALIPVIALVLMLAVNVYLYGDNSLGGSNQFVLLLGAAVAGIVGSFNGVSYKKMVEEVAQNIKSTTGAILILLMVGALAGTWLLSGIIPTMIYYGLDLLNPSIFLTACVIICAVISISTGSSWTTSATVGIALIGIAGALDISAGMTAGAVLSGAYFGDKLSPLSDTTNLAPAMAGTDLFTHIKYMTYTTVPTILVTLFVFMFIGFTIDSAGDVDVSEYQAAIDATFNTSAWLFLVPIIVIAMIVKKVSPLIALLLGTLLAGVFALIFQNHIVYENGLKYQITEIQDEFKSYVEWDNTSSNNFQNPGTYTLQPVEDSDVVLSEPVVFNLPSGGENDSFTTNKTVTILKDDVELGTLELSAVPTGYAATAYFAIMNAITVSTSVDPITNNTKIKDKLTGLFEGKGMESMLGTIWLIVCAMVFGGVMDAIGALARISRALLHLFDSVFGLFASTVVSCLAINVTASDQYLALVVPGKMYAKAYKDKGLAPENLSRTLEDSGTVTSVLIPWNTCGAYQSSTLGVDVKDYFVYAIFNWLSPFMTLLFAAFRIKIRQLTGKQPTLDTIGED